MALDLGEFLAVINGASTNELHTCWHLIEDQLGRSFHIGDKIQFNAGSGALDGVVMKINAKTIKVKVGNGMMWNVAPMFLRKV